MKPDPTKYAFILPNIFTSANLFCGFLSIIFSLEGQLYRACVVIIFGALFDLADGRVARLTNTQSAFGEQFDSLTDLLTFGIAPAFLLYRFAFHELGHLGIFITFLFVFCGALRLARFNSNLERVDSSFFQGLPIPSAAFAIVGYIFAAILAPQIFTNIYLVCIYTVFYAVLMITNLPFYSFKNASWLKRYRKRFFVLLVILAAVTYTYEKIMILALISIYVFSSLIYYLKNRKTLKGIFEWDGENEETLP